MSLSVMTCGSACGIPQCIMGSTRAASIFSISSALIFLAWQVLARFRLQPYWDSYQVVPGETLLYEKLDALDQTHYARKTVATLDGEFDVDHVEKIRTFNHPGAGGGEYTEQPLGGYKIVLKDIEETNKLLQVSRGQMNPSFFLEMRMYKTPKFSFGFTSFGSEMELCRFDLQKNIKKGSQDGNDPAGHFEIEASDHRTFFLVPKSDPDPTIFRGRCERQMEELIREISEKIKPGIESKLRAKASQFWRSDVDFREGSMEDGGAQAIINSYNIGNQNSWNAKNTEKANKIFEDYQGIRDRLRTNLRT